MNIEYAMVLMMMIAVFMCGYSFGNDIHKKRKIKQQHDMLLNKMLEISNDDTTPKQIKKFINESINNVRRF